MSPCFSAIIPTFNRWQLAQDAIESALAQTYPCHEIIVVDDGSSDGTAERLGQRFGDRIRLITKPNGGVSTARNVGVSAATGDYIAYLDSDDLWEPDKLARINEALALFPEKEVFLFSDFRRYDMATGSYYPQTNTQLFPRIFKRLEIVGAGVYHAGGLPALQCVVEDYPFFPSTFVIHRSIHDHFRWDPSVRYSEDFNFVAKVADRHPFIYVDQPLATVRMHDSNKSANWLAKLESHMNTLQTVALRSSNDPIKQGEVQRALGRRHFGAARQLARSSQPIPALKHLLRAMLIPRYWLGAIINILGKHQARQEKTSPATFSES